MNVHRRYHLTSQSIAARVPGVLAGRGLDPAFAAWMLTEHRGRVWLFGVLDVAKLDRLERYTADDVLHHVSTALNGTPVYLSNSNGLRYAFLLSQPPRLPRKVDFPGLQRGVAQLGVGIDGQAVAVPWKDLGHLLVAGMTGSGKSVFIQLLVYQALAEGAQLLVADMDGATLPMLAGHPALLEPIAATPDQARVLIRRATAECSRRATLYATTKGYPADLDEYNALAVGRAKPVLPRVLVVLDEFNATVTALGGGRGGFAGDVAALAMRGRKFGLHAVLASQDFAKSSVGRVRDQMHAICFRVRSAELARSVGCAGAERIPARLSGRAVTDRWGIVQAFYLDKSLLVGVSLETPAPVLSELEQALVAWALRENDSYLGLADIQDRTGEGPRAARRLADEWEQRGWLAKDAQAGNKRRITGELATFADKLTNPTTPDKPTDRPANPTNPARSPAVEGEVS